MPQVLTRCDSTAVPDNEVQKSVDIANHEFSSAVYAANDAHNLNLALTANLEWISDALTLDQLGDDIRPLLRDAVEVCRKLTLLLGGAIGSCRAANRPKSGSSNRLLPLCRVVEGVLGRVSKVADSVGVLIVDEGGQDLFVSVDVDTMNQALETLLLQALNSSRASGVVRVSYTRCGAHAVVGITTQGQGCTTEQLQQLHSTSHFSNVDDSWSPPLVEAYSSLSLMLLEQGGYIDVEIGNDGIVTVFLVVPVVDESVAESTKSGTAFANDDSIERGGASASGQKRSETMIVNSDRFGVIEVDTDDVLSFPTGIIGFPDENEFVLIRKADSQMIGWLQSTHSSYLTLPVVSAHVLAPRYPDVAVEDFAERAGLGSTIDELAVLAVLSAPPNLPATVNLMAPIIVNAVTRRGAQVLLEGTRFSTRELFILPPTPVTNDEPPAQSEEAQTAQPATTSAAE